MKYFGEQESQVESNEALAKNLPLTFFLMFVTLLFLFRTYRKPTVILLMLPLIFIGLVLGLVLLGKSFDFFSILGLLGLIGMNIKNAIVLVEQIDLEMCIRDSDKPFYHKFASILRTLIRRKTLTLGSMVVLFVASLVIMGMMPQNFFPSLDKPYFRADVFYPDGYSINDVVKEMKSVEEHLAKQPEVKKVSITFGSTPLRYYLCLLYTSSDSGRHDGDRVYRFIHE